MGAIPLPKTGEGESFCPKAIRLAVLARLFKKNLHHSESASLSKAEWP
jgi:hypothetical protein